MQIGDIIIIISTFITSLATVTIAIYACKTNSLAKKIDENNEKHQIKFEDLFEAIIISNIVAAGRSPNKSEVDSAKKIFKSNYKGTTKIFKEE